ncbi:MAG: hypothetical protein ABF292_04110, partial [Desulfobacterales bacterium]
VKMAQFLYRSNWPLFRPAAGLNPEPGTDQLRMLNPQRRRDIRIRQRKKRGSLAATGDVELDPGFNYDGKYLMSNGNSLIL